MNSRSDMRRLAAQAPDKLIQEIERLRKENDRLVRAIGVSLGRRVVLASLLRVARDTLATIGHYPRLIELIDTTMGDDIE